MVGTRRRSGSSGGLDSRTAMWVSEHRQRDPDNRRRDTGESRRSMGGRLGSRKKGRATAGRPQLFVTCARQGAGDRERAIYGLQQSSTGRGLRAYAETARTERSR